MTQNSSKNRRLKGLLWFGLFLLLIVIFLAFILQRRQTAQEVAVGASSVQLHLPLPAAAAIAPATSTPPTVSAATTQSLAASPSPATGISSVSKGLSAAKMEKTVLALPGTTCRSAGWYVQLAAFGSLAGAQELAQHASQAGVPACIGNLPHNRLYRVLVGHPQASRLAASQLMQKISAAKISKSSGYPQYWSPAAQS